MKTALNLLIGLALLTFTPDWPAGLPLHAQGGGQTTVTVTTLTIPTHAYDQALVYYTNPTYNMPYTKLDGIRYDPGKIINRSYNLIILENDYLKVSLLPELGGRIYQAVFKPTGNNMFYQNPVLKPSPGNPRKWVGGWLPGGWSGACRWKSMATNGYPLELPNHRPARRARVDLWDTTATNRLRAKIAVTLPDEAAYFQVSPTLENPTGRPIDYKFWLNAMLAPGPPTASALTCGLSCPRPQ